MHTDMSTIQKAVGLYFGAILLFGLFIGVQFFGEEQGSHIGMSLLLCGTLVALVCSVAMSRVNVTGKAAPYLFGLSVLSFSGWLPVFILMGYRLFVPTKPKDPSAGTSNPARCLPIWAACNIALGFAFFIMPTIYHIPGATWMIDTFSFGLDVDHALRIVIPFCIFFFILKFTNAGKYLNFNQFVHGLFLVGNVILLANFVAHILEPLVRFSYDIEKTGWQAYRSPWMDYIYFIKCSKIFADLFSAIAVAILWWRSGSEQSDRTT
jgi:hypothetical protein